MSVFVTAPTITVNQIASGFAFSEGPLLYNNRLLVSDGQKNEIIEVDPYKSKKTFLSGAGLYSNDRAELSDMIGSNGLAIYKDHLIVCQHGEHAIARYENDQLRPFISDYNNRPFNSPNDLVVSNNDMIFFTDPPYGLKDQVLRPGSFQPAAGLYSFDGNTIRLMFDKFNYPNGVALSNDQKYLFLSSNHPDEARIMKFELDEKGSIVHEEIFAHRNADGIMTDHEDNLFLATAQGIEVLSSEGVLMRTIEIPEEPTNLCWDSPECTGLYITARTSVYHAIIT